MRITILIAILVSLSFYFYVANAKPVKVKVEQVGKSPKEKTDSITIIEVLDNQNGTSTLLMDACGTTLMFTYSNEDAVANTQDVLDVINKTVTKTCKR